MAPTIATAQPDPAAQAEAAYRQARTAFKAGDFDAAVRFLEEAWSAKQEPIFRYHMARSYEAAGKNTEAMQAALTFISLMAEVGATDSVYLDPLTESWAIVSRTREATQASALEIDLPEARICPQPVVTAGGVKLEPVLDGLAWRVTVPPAHQAKGDLSIRCEGLEAPASAPGFADSVAPYVFGAGLGALAAGGYFGARYIIADGELSDIDVVTDEAALGSTAREITRTRQQRDDFDESALIVGGVGAGLLLTATVLWLAGGDDGPTDDGIVPAVTPDGAALWWQGRF